MEPTTDPVPVVRWKPQPIGPLLEFGPHCPHAVYFIFDDTGALIYVGVSNEPRLRIRTHGRSATWAGQMASWSATWYSNRADAERAERLAIIREQPRCNVMGTPRFVERMAESNTRRRRKVGA